MNEMVERVAEAIFQSACRTYFSASANIVIDARLCEQETSQQDRFRMQARAAIAAMENPTKGMIEAAEKHDTPPNYDGALPHSGWLCGHGTTWRAMIDEALRE